MLIKILKLLLVGAVLSALSLFVTYDRNEFDSSPIGNFIIEVPGTGGRLLDKYPLAEDNNTGRYTNSNRICPAVVGVSSTTAVGYPSPMLQHYVGEGGGCELGSKWDYWEMSVWAICLNILIYAGASWLVIALFSLVRARLKKIQA